MMQAQVARIFEVANVQTPHHDINAKAEILKRAFVMAWGDRKEFKPTEESLAHWFSVRVVRARLDYRASPGVWVTLDGEAFELLKVLSGLNQASPELPAVRHKGVPAYEFVEVPEIEQPQIVGQECPPCWRCRYFDGWLPTREIVVRIYDDDEITMACKLIDQRKIEIAHMVRGTYPAELLELPE